MRHEVCKSTQCLNLTCRACGAEPGHACFDRRRGYSNIYPHKERFEDLRDLKAEALLGSSTFKIHPAPFRATIGRREIPR